MNLNHTMVVVLVEGWKSEGDGRVLSLGIEEERRSVAIVRHVVFVYYFIATLGNGSALRAEWVGLGA